jgi:RNA polymerase-binding transcription factor DksA
VAKKNGASKNAPAKKPNGSSKPAAKGSKDSKGTKAPVKPVVKAGSKPASKPAGKVPAKAAPKAAAKAATKAAPKPVVETPKAKPAAGKAPASAGTAGVKPTHIGKITEPPPPPPPKRRGILPPLFGPPPTPPKRSKGAPPPVIAKPKPKKKPGAENTDKTPKKKIDYANAVSVAAAAVQAAAAPAQPSKKAPLQPGLVMISGRRVRTLSLKGIKIVRTPKSSSKSAATKAVETAPVVLAKTKLTPKELEGYRDILNRMRRELAGRVHDLEEEALKSSGGNLSNMPLHMADVGTDTFDQDFNIGMAQAERGIVQEIDEALKRIADRTYGMCMLTGKPIPKGRLAAMPWAKYTVEAARQVEKSRPRPQ